MKQDRCSRWLDAIYETLATGAQPGVELEAHLQSCSDCHAEWEETQFLRQRLQGELRQRTSDDRFTAAVWRKIEAAERTPAKRPLLSWRFGVPALAVAASICALIIVLAQPSQDILPEFGGSHSARPSGTGTKVAKGNQPSTSDPAAGSNNKPKAVGPKSSTRKKPNVSAKKSVRSSVNASKSRLTNKANQRPAYQRTGRTMVANNTSRIGSKIGTQVTPKELASNWQAWGEYYSGQGYSELAAAAYQRQYSITGDPSAAYNAGCAAETAGDFSTALKSYIQCLQPSTQKDARPNEGANHWTRDLDV